MTSSTTRRGFLTVAAAVTGSVVGPGTTRAPTRPERAIAPGT